MADDLERAISALRNADAAGDTAAAKQIANAIKQMQSARAMIPQQPQDIGDVGGMAAHATQGALASFGDEYLAGLSAALGVQPDGQGGARWFDYSKPMGERYDTALGAIRSEMEQYREENPVKAGGAQIAGAIGGAVAAAPAVARGAGAVGIKAAETGLGKVAQVAGGGAIGGAVEGYGAGEGGIGERAKSAAIGAGVGAIFAPLVGIGVAKIGKAAERVGGRAVRAVFQSKRMFNPNSGTLTEAGKKRLKDLGIDDLDALSREMQQSLGVAAEKMEAGAEGADAATLRRIAAGERFDVPLTKGQASGMVPQIAREENFRAGTRGQGAYETIQGFDRMQRSAIDTARENIIPRGGDVAPDSIDAAEAIVSGVRREAENARQAGRAAYQALDETGAAVSGNAFPSLRNQIETAVRSEGVNLDAGTPNAQAAMNVLQSAFEGAQQGAVPFNQIERARSRMLGFQRAAARGDNGADQFAINSVVKEFDGWLDDTITDALVAGDDTVLDQAKNARELWSQYRRTFLGREGADNFVRKIVEDDLSPDQVAGWIYGASNNIGGGQSSLVAKRLKGILGEDSPEWLSVRRAAWDRVTQATEGRPDYGPRRIANNISELLEGKGKTLSRELFSDDQRKVMGEFRDLMNVLVAPDKATNRSGTSYDMQRAIGEMSRNLGIVMGGATGGPVGALGAAAGKSAIETGGNFRAVLQARAAANGIYQRAASPAVAAGAGVGTGAALQEELGR